MTNNILYVNGVVEVHNDYVSVYDEEFQSSISFDSDRRELEKAYKEYPEYFTDDALITIYHFLRTGKFVDACEISGEVECRIVGRGASEDIEYALQMVDDGYQWIDLYLEEQKQVLAKNIRMLLN